MFPEGLFGVWVRIFILTVSPCLWHPAPRSSHHGETGRLYILLASNLPLKGQKLLSYFLPLSAPSGPSLL